MRQRRRYPRGRTRRHRNLSNIDEGGWLLIPEDVLSINDDYLPDFMIGTEPETK
jgi:hypothetical protein